MLHHLDRAEEYLAQILLASLGILLTVQVVLRYFFGIGFGAVEEAARVMFLWVIFLGAVVGMRRNLHIRVTFGLKFLPVRLRRIVFLAGELVLFAFCLAVAWHGLQVALSTLSMPFRLPVTRVSMFWPYLIIPISFGLQALRLLIWHAQEARRAPE